MPLLQYCRKWTYTQSVNFTWNFLELLLYGNLNLPNDLNTRIIESVHKYIFKTKRFSCIWFEQYVSSFSWCSTFESASRPHRISLSHPPIYICYRIFVQSSNLNSQHNCPNSGSLIECDQLHYICYVASSYVFHLFFSLFSSHDIVHFSSSLDNVHFTNYIALPIICN